LVPEADARDWDVFAFEAWFTRELFVLAIVYGLKGEEALAWSCFGVLWF
jgi:hypothetical protein